MFERVLAEDCALDPTIDVVKTLNLSRDEIIKRMPHNVKTLRRLIQAADADFRTVERASSAAARDRMRHDLYRRLRKAIVLAEELSPRIDLLDRCADELAVRRGRWPTSSTKSTAAAAPPPTGSAAPSSSSSCAT